MSATFLEYDHLHDCEIYFAGLVSGGSYLGDIEPGEGEISHLASLIAGEFKKDPPYFHSTLSVAVFLVWMGWQHYQEGNYWGPVYRELELPQTQIKWQGVLGETFLQAVRKYNLSEFQGKQRYISPILAHGYIPDWHLESYFKDIVMTIYKEREKAKLQIKREEIKHQILSWRSDFEGYEKNHNRIGRIELVEKRLLNIYKAWQHRDLLRALRELKEKLIDKVEMDELLAYPEGQLEKLEIKRSACKKEYDFLRDQDEEQKRIKKLLENQKIGLQVLEGEIKETASQILENWNDDFTKPVLALPVNKIGDLIEKIEVQQRMFSGIIGWFLRIMTPVKYRRFYEKKQKLLNFLRPLPLKAHLQADFLPILRQTLFKLQDLLKQYNKSLSVMAELNMACQEVVATIGGVAVEGLDIIRDKLDRLSQELTRYKTKLVWLGKGDLEKGKKVLAEQRKLLQKIELLKEKIPGDVCALMTLLPIAENYSDIKRIENRLVKIRKRKKEAKEHLKVFKNPLYTLNESTRIFILQGEEKAVEFVFQSLLLFDGLRKNRIGEEIILPDRIEQAMKYWWGHKGKSLFEKNLEERAWKRPELNDAYIRKPVVNFDPIHKEIKVALLRQPVREKADAIFYIHGESGQRQKAVLPLIFEEGVYWSETIEIKLKRPELFYHLQFSCGDTTRSWQVKGVGLDGFCMLFNMQGELIDDNQLPEDGGVYLIAPVGSHIDPVEAIKEQLSGFWSGYEYRLVNSEGNDVIVVRTGTNISTYRRSVQVQPTLLSHKVLHGITAGGARIYGEQLPNLIFSVSHPEEIMFYGLRLDVSGETLYKTLEELRVLVNKENVVYLPLDGLAMGQYGLYEMALTKRGNIIWTEQFAFLPDLGFAFDRVAYKVQDRLRETGRLEFNTKQKFEFIPEGSTSVIKPLSTSVVEFDSSQNIIQGSLAYHFEQKLVVMINVEVPAIRWRQKGADWKAKTEEIWHEDLGEIEVKVPASIDRSIALSLKGDKQILSNPVRQGIATFNLCRFSDTLRDSSKALQEVILNCDNLEISPFILLRVRIRWQAAKINLIQNLHESSRHLVIEWEDRGRAANRVARLWPLNMPGINPIEKEIPDGANNLSITVPKELVPPGHYRLQLDMIDSWNSFDVLMPEQATENCIDVDIGTKEEHLNNYLGKRLKIISLYHGEQGAELETYYWLEVTELNPMFEGEVRLVGNLYSLAADGTAVSMPYNPVSFYISNNKMPFLIDKDGDGATYCRKCKVMFWEVAHKKCGDAVLAPDSILVKMEEDQ